MQQKGIGEEDMIDALAELDENTEYESAKALAKKYLKGKNLEDEKVREKIFRYLVSRGYSYDTIKKVIRALGVEIEEN